MVRSYSNPASTASVSDSVATSSLKSYQNAAKLEVFHDTMVGVCILVGSTTSPRISTTSSPGVGAGAGVGVGVGVGSGSGHLRLIHG